MTSTSILVVANYASDVGYAWWLMERFWHQIGTAAAARGVQCVLAYPQVRTVPPLISASPIELLEFRFGHRSLQDIWSGLKLIRQRRIRAVYLTDWPHLHWCYLLWRLAGIQEIVIHDHTPGDRPPIGGWRGAAKSWLHALRGFSATLYVAVSDHIRQRMELNGRVPASRCVVVTNGVQGFHRSAVDAGDLRQQLGVPQDAVLIVMVSRLTYYKGIDFAIRCFAHLFEDEGLRQRVFAVHCGDGPDRTAFTKLAQDAALGMNFQLLGRRDDVRAILCASDIAFHPSRGEAMSLAILEFMCAELAVVVPDLPSVSAAIQQGVTGVTYQAENVQSAASQLRSLIDDPPRRRMLGVAAADSCRRDFSLEAMSRRFAQVVVPVLLPETGIA
jgi:glycosyltransferase involved in cell wall biosynthesis